MKKLNVLLIDDDEDDRDVFSSAIALLRAQPNCMVLGNAETALVQLEQDTIAPDVIFLDLNMPRMDGREFYMQVKARHKLKNIPIVLFSTSSYLESVRSAELNGAPFIAKPENFSELTLLLENYFDSNFPSVSGVACA